MARPCRALPWRPRPLRKGTGGEGFDGVQKRVPAFLSEAKGPAVIVAHKVVLLLLWGMLFGFGPAAVHKRDAPQGAVIAVSDGQGTILL
jgi:probable phosphoglycerate mutase